MTILELLAEEQFPLLKIAHGLATKAHFGVSRKKSGLPYIVHVENVIEGSFKIALESVECENLSDVLKNHKLETLVELDCILAVAALHDVVEDNPLKYPAHFVKTFLTVVLKKEGYWLTYEPFIDEIIQAVENLTKKPKGTEDYPLYVWRVLSHGWSIAVKKADLLDNMKDGEPGNLLQKYQLTYWILSKAATVDFGEDFE